MKHRNVFKKMTLPTREGGGGQSQKYQKKSSLGMTVSKPIRVAADGIISSF